MALPFSGSLSIGDASGTDRSIAIEVFGFVPGGVSLTQCFNSANLLPGQNSMIVFYGYDNTGSNPPSGSNPNSPTGVVFNYNYSTNEAFVSWTDQSNDENGFLVEYEIVGNSYTMLFDNNQATVSSNVTTYSTFIGPGPDTKNEVTFRVRSYNTFGNSAWAYSNTIDISPSVNTAIPVAPSNVDLTYNYLNEQAFIEWNDNSNNETLFELEYSIEAQTYNQPFSNRVSLNDNVTTYSEFIASSGFGFENLTYRIRAINEFGESPWAISNTVDISSTDTPNPPSNVFFNYNLATNEVFLNWDDNSNNEGFFEIQYEIIANNIYSYNTNNTDSVPPNTTFYTRLLAPVEPGLNVVTFRVRSVGNLGNNFSPWAYSNSETINF